uniref:Uncharacterized protein n=1 Tax=Arthrobacter sp. J3.37 TaxID=347208 RepID=I3W0V0_9MICC|nr:hypothetical protein [Arthrobacter sp. J3.37]
MSAPHVEDGGTRAPWQEFASPSSYRQTTWLFSKEAKKAKDAA